MGYERVTTDTAMPRGLRQYYNRAEGGVYATT